MRDVLSDVLPWWDAGHPVALATVVETWRSAPRQAGASMAVGPAGEAWGSVSGGCVESDVYELCLRARDTGAPSLQRYGVSTDDALAVGLTCGGILDVFVEQVSKKTFPGLAAVAADIAAGRPVAVATLIEHPDPARVGGRLVLRPGRDAPGRAVPTRTTRSRAASQGDVRDEPELGTLGSDRFDDAVTTDARGLLAGGLSETLTYGPEGERRGEGARVFVASYAPRPRMIVFGAIDFAAALTRMGAFLGYHVTLCDARPVFATRARFPEADEVVVDWPHRYLAAEVAAGRVLGTTAIAVLTHDAKFDVPLLEVALRLDEVGFVGAMGSRRTHDDRLARLRAAGLTDDELNRLSSPIGLDLGARTPEETAVSIAAEIIARSWGGAGVPLRSTDGPIHRE